MPISRRSFLAASIGAAAAGSLGDRLSDVIQTSLLNDTTPEFARAMLRASRPRPTPSQLLWQRDELALFLHFGVNTFTDREWGDGRESPSIFAPTRFDANQWAQVAKAAGYKALVLTAKHHDGFCLWPTATTKHSVASSPWKEGKGDVVREMVDACKAHDLRVGLYCSPWDRNHVTYGDSSRYNEVFRAQLSELLSNYGEIHEVWFDGANGEGPNGKRQIYDWPATFAHVRKLQPNAVIFSDAGPDVRWIGNERGVAGETNWSTIRSSAVPFPGATGDGIIEALQSGHSDGDVWRPGETDVSIRPGWFYHPAEDSRVKTVDDLVSIYFSSVGRNSKLLLNVPPTREGRLHSADVASLRGMQATLASMFSKSRAVSLSNESFSSQPSSAVYEARLQHAQEIAVVDLRESIEEGQRVARWSFEVDSGSGYREVAAGSTIGYRALRRIPPVAALRVRIRIHETVEQPLPIKVALYSPS